MTDDTILEAIEFTIAEKTRRLEYYKTQISDHEADLKRLETQKKALLSKNPKQQDID